MASPSSSPTPLTPSSPQFQNPPSTQLLPLPGPESDPLLPNTHPKKAIPVPWTNQETINLIQAYQEKWYSLKKGQMKASQWEEVAVTVAARCGFDEPSKTAVQCRHKLEKLRKRYRAECLKPYPNPWQYFELMAQLEHGPLPLNARPLAAVNSPSNDNINNKVNIHTGSADYHCNATDDSDEEWNGSYSGAAKNRSKNINNIVHGDMGAKSGVKNMSKVGMERSFSGGNNRVLRNPVNGKRKYYADGDDSDNEAEGEQDDILEEGGGGMKLASEMRGFVERFMKMESNKIEMMRETERHRMEMEKKKVEIILESHRKIIDSIGRAFAANKRMK